MQCIEPKVSSRLLKNPGVGFFWAPGLETADSPRFQEPVWRFTEDSQAFCHPDSRVGFVSARWARLEPREGHYDWSSVDDALARMGAAGKVAVFRCAPYALEDDDIPAWLRERNPHKPDFPFWQIDPNTSDYAACWARFVRALSAHLDGHPFLSSVDIALVGAWGEGGGTEFLQEDKLHLIADAYLQGYTRTPLQCLLHDPRSVGYIRSSGRPVGFRVDCLGDMGGFHGKRWSHMLDFYPQNIQNFGMDRAWERAPVIFEACWTMQDWYRNDWDIDYIIRESLKWHISSFNSKGVPVPAAWRSQVEDWARRMGYRFELRRVLHPETVDGDGRLTIKTLWRNSGVAPCYQSYPLQYLLKGPSGTEYRLRSAADIRRWLPDEDHLEEDTLDLSALPAGTYQLLVGIQTELPGFPPLELANEGCEAGYVPAGTVRIGRDE